VSALACDNDVTAVKKNLASLIRQLATGLQIVFDSSIEDITPPIAQAMTDKIIERSGLDIMAAIDDLPIPSDPSTVVKKLVSTMMDRLFSLQQPATLPSQPIPSPPQPQPTGSEAIALLASNPKFLAQSNSGNSKQIQHMSNVSMQEIARNKVAMTQLVSLKDIDASQLFELLKANSLVPPLVLVIFCGHSTGGHIEDWDHIVSIREDIVQLAGAHIAKEHTGSLKTIGTNSNLLLALQFAARGCANLFPWWSFMKSIPRSTAVQHGTATEAEVLKSALDKAPPPSIFGDNFMAQLMCTELFGITHSITRPFDPNALDIISDSLKDPLHTAAATNNVTAQELVSNLIPVVLKFMSPGTATVESSLSILLPVPTTIRYVFEKTGHVYQIDVTSPLQEKPLTIRPHSLQGLTTEVNTTKLALLVSSSHERNLSLSVNGSYPQRHHSNHRTSNTNNYSGKRTSRRQPSTYHHRQVAQQPPSQGNSQPHGNSQLLRIKSTALVSDPNRRGEVWASAALFEQNGTFPHKIRPDDIAPKTYARIQAALHEFATHHNHRVLGPSNVDLCPMGFHLPQPHSGNCSCGRRHIQAQAWTTTVRSAEIMHMMNQQKPYLQITAAANSDIPQRK